MKITPTILSISPYLSTTWDNITSLHSRNEKGSLTLIVHLQNLTTVEVPNLSQTELDAIFDAHAKFTESKLTPRLPNLPSPFNFSLPLKTDGPIGSLGSSMEHNPDQADLPPIPTEILKKIAMIAKAFGLEDASFLQKPEPHCNCTYCQICRSLQNNEENSSDSTDEVSEEDLTFRNWEIKQTDQKLYVVTNPLDSNEYYNVFLGSPIGCTCGSKNCEHIRAVLNS
jgi:hypothetical protein